MNGALNDDDDGDDDDIVRRLADVVNGTKLMRQTLHRTLAHCTRDRQTLTSVSGGA